MEDLKAFVSKVSLLGLSSLLASISPLVLLPFLTNNLSIVNYGVFVQFTTTMAILPAITILGLPYTFVRYMSATKDHKTIQESFYSITFMIGLVNLALAFVLFIFAGPLSKFLFDSNIAVAIILPVTIFFTAFIMLSYDIFRTFRRNNLYSFFITAQAYLTVFIVALFVTQGYGILGAIIGILITQIIVFVIMFSMVVKMIGFSFPKFHNIWQYLNFGIPTIPSNLSTFILDASDRYIIGYLIGLPAVGFYSGGFLLGSLISVLLSPFFTILLPILARYHAERDVGNIRRYLNHSIKLFLVVAIPATFILTVLSKNLLLVLSTPEIASQGYLITPIVAVGGIFYGLYGIVTQIIVLENKTKLTGNIWIIAAIINLILAISLGYMYGIIGVALTTLGAYIFAFTLTSYYAFKFIRCNFYYKFIFKAMTASIIITLMLIFIDPHGLIYILLSMLGSFIIYLLIMLVLRGIRMYEINFFLDILREPTKLE
ncbi:MAG: lipopolysaccharide biosynthesis protein [Methanobacterium sp. ERen5]|nr:MAG: lipopolysaccharide biosynthesis protein [Methanobacterium sp. ERen5]